MADKKKDVKEPFKVSRLSISPMISYQLNNLATSESYIAYINSNQTNKIIVYALQDKELGDHSIIKGFEDTITSLNYFNIWGSWKLVATYIGGFMIFSENGKIVLKQYSKILSKEKNGEASSFYNTSAHVRSRDKSDILCIGTTNSEIYFCEYKSHQNYEVSIGINFNTKRTEISALASANSINYLVTGDVSGDIHIFLIEDSKDISMIKNVEGSNHQAPINTMKILSRQEQYPSLSNILVYGDYIGRIIIFDLSDFCQIAQINTHVRMITSLDVCDKKNEIISGSEDTYLNIWRIDPDNEVHLKVSYRLADQMVMGIQYLKNRDSSIYVSCLEANELTFLQSNQ